MNTLVKFYKVKKEIRNLGIEDGPFTKDSKKTILVGSVHRGGKWPDGFLVSKVTVDGTDATDQIIKMVNRTRHKDQLRIIFLDGITYGGFNIVDIQKVFQKTGLPVIVVQRKFPDFKGIKAALEKNFEDAKERWELIKKAGKIHKLKPNKKYLYVQFTGIKISDVKEILKICCTRSDLPESIRVSHLLASAIVEGESRGRA